MKKIIITLIIFAALLGGAYIYMNENGHTFESISNSPNKIGLSVNCGSVNNALATSTVSVKVNNNSSRTHNNVTIRIVAYDKKGNIVKEKETVFLRTLSKHGSLMKVVTLPAKAVSCDCVVLNSSPQ